MYSERKNIGWRTLPLPADPTIPIPNPKVFCIHRNYTNVTFKQQITILTAKHAQVRNLVHATSSGTKKKKKIKNL